MSTSTEARDDAVRQLLVQTFSRRPRRPWRITALVAVAAFVLGGGITAGALSAAAVSRAYTPTKSDFEAQTVASFLQGGYSIGPIVTFTGTGTTHLRLGARPDDATAFVYEIQCQGNGKVISTVAGGVTGTGGSPCRSGEGFGSNVSKNLSDGVAVTTDGKFMYTVFAQWISVPVIPPAAPSAAELAAVADGVVTESDWHAAADRYVACMAGAGFTETATFRHGPVPSFEAPSNTDPNSSSVASTRCSGSELNLISKLWSKEHPQ